MIDVVAADVSIAADVRALFARIDRTHGRLCGIVHAAGVLRDATVLATSNEQARAVFAPKVVGALNLYAACGSRPLEFFVTFSSVASFLGMAGQANYAAANAVVDALAAARRAQGVSAISIGWGPWSAVGLAAAEESRGARLAGLGLESLSPQTALDTLALVLERRPVHAVAMRFAPATWQAQVGQGRALPLLASLAVDDAAVAAPDGSSSETPIGTGELRGALLAIEPGPRRRTLIEEQVQQLVARVLRLPASRVETNRPLRTVGLDSLMGLELRNHLEIATGQKLPATLIWNYSTVVALAAELARRMDVVLEPSTSAESLTPAGSGPPESETELESLLAELENLSEEEAKRLLTGGR
jgi:NAD(P)-dependent dehydrogenase (short-subunit alcohol dehydrogenase family)/acyl carrier protein